MQHGYQLGSQHPGPELPIFDYLPESLLDNLCNRRDFPRCLVLDKWVGNADGRQAVFIRKPRGRRFNAMFIDQGYALNAGEWDFPDSALRGVYARNCVYKDVTGWDSFEPALTRAEEAHIIDIWRCAEQIPAEWYEYDHDGLNSRGNSLSTTSDHSRSHQGVPGVESKSISKLDERLIAVWMVPA